VSKLIHTQAAWKIIQIWSLPLRSSSGNEACSNLNWECWWTYQANNLEVCAMLLCSMKLRWDEKLVCWNPLCDVVHAI